MVWAINAWPRRRRSRYLSQGASGSHPETDEVFLVLAGWLTIRLDDGEATLDPDQLYVVPRVVHHQPVSMVGAEVLLIEPSDTEVRE